MKVNANGNFYADIHFQLVPSGVHEYPRYFDVDKTHKQKVMELGLEPLYEEDMRQWRVVDAQHLIRYTRNYKTLAYVGNDSLAKDELRMTAEIFRLGFHEIYSGYTEYVQGSGLLSRMLHVQRTRVQAWPWVGEKLGEWTPLARLTR